jgi:hypothetical protein
MPKPIESIGFRIIFVHSSTTGIEPTIVATQLMRGETHKTDDGSTHSIIHTVTTLQLVLYYSF